MGDYRKRVLRGVGKRLRQLRERRDWSQEQLAEQVGRTDKHISEVELGKTNFGVDLLIKSAEIFGINVDDFFRGLSNDSASTMYLISEEDVDRIREVSEVAQRLKRQRVKRKRSK